MAALRPDLILATNTYALEEKSVYDRLRRIAPTVHFVDSSLSDSWQDVMRRVGQALGQEARATELVAEAEGDLAAVRERTPEFEGKTVNFFNADPSGLYTINEPKDYAIRLLADLGLRLSPPVAALKGEGGRAVISAERYDVLDSDLLIGTSLLAPGARETRGRHAVQAHRRRPRETLRPAGHRARDVDGVPVGAQRPPRSGECRAGARGRDQGRRLRLRRRPTR